MVVASISKISRIGHDDGRNYKKQQPLDNLASLEMPIAFVMDCVVVAYISKISQDDQDTTCFA